MSLRSRESKFVAAIAFALGVGVAASAGAAETLTIGAIGPLTGPGSAWGLGLANGVKFAAQEINAKGGLKVGNKVYEVKVIAYDEQYKATEAVAAYNRLVSQDGVKFIIGPLSSSGTLAVKSMVEENKTIIFTGAYSSKAIDPKTQFLFRAYSTPQEYIGPMVKWLKQNQAADKRRVALLNPNDETGWDATRLQEGSYKDNGFQIVGKELYERSVKDFQPLLTKVLAAKPDVIELGTSSPATAGLIVRQGRELGYKGRFIKIGGPGPREIVAASGKESAEGVLNYMLGNPASETYKRLASEYKRVNGHDMNDVLPAFYDATRVLFAAMQKAGTVSDTEKVRLAIPKVMPFAAALGGELNLAGKSTYGADTQILTVSYVGEIRKGEVVILGVAK
jgi:branched-chain amino acid transport system substrate-binding protein